jgi:uncharacterized protein YcsI (UPF0317 family)
MLEMNAEQLRQASGSDIRTLCRSGAWDRSTAGVATGYYQANLVVVPQIYAFEFLAFCHRNPKPCPLIDVTDPGDPEFRLAAPGSDVRKDLPRYCIYRNGELVDETTDILDLWRPHHVAFLLGCSFSTDDVLQSAGVQFARIDGSSGRFGAYISNIPCNPAGRFNGSMVVNARPVIPEHVGKAVAITTRFPLAHGGPVHIGDPAQIGVDLDSPQWGIARRVDGAHVPVFWACGVTPQAIAMQNKLPEMITHKAAHMFVTDLSIADPVHW